MLAKFSEVSQAAADSGGSSGSGLVILGLVVVLIIAGRALLVTIGAIWGLISELLASLFTGVRALILIGIALTIVVIFFLHDPAAAVGLMAPTLPP